MPHKLALWFRMLEIQFKNARILKEELKFTTALAHIPGKYIEQIEEIIMNPPDEGQYQFLKEEIVKRFSDSRNTRVKKLLENQELGDRKPSQFYRDLKALAAGTVPDDFVLTLWKGRLPAEVQRILTAANTSDAATLQCLADEMMEIPLATAYIARVSIPSPAEDWRQEMREIVRQEISAMSINHRRREDRAHSRNRYRSKSRTKDQAYQHDAENRDGLCWYHYRYRERSNKCRSPCNWAAKNEISCQ